MGGRLALECLHRLQSDLAEVHHFFLIEHQPQLRVGQFEQMSEAGNQIGRRRIQPGVGQLADGRQSFVITGRHQIGNGIEQDLALRLMFGAGDINRHTVHAAGLVALGQKQFGNGPPARQIGHLGRQWLLPA